MAVSSRPLTIDLDPDILAQHRTLRRPVSSAPLPHCDMCAADLPRAYVHAVLYGEHVQLCPGGCLATLRRVWTPTIRIWTGWDVVGAAVAVMLLSAIWFV